MYGAYLVIKKGKPKTNCEEVHMDRHILTKNSGVSMSKPLKQMVANMCVGSSKIRWHQIRVSDSSAESAGICNNNMPGILSPCILCA
jgi:hypothetical protein